jgi:uncharacterized SAM-binding protein YcdF (DUF218 family)
MFFFFSKVLTFLFSPMVWFFGLVFWSFKTKDERKRKRLFIGALLLLYICSNSFVVDELFRAWEFRTADYYLMDTKYDVAIVLGGIARIDERQGKADFMYSSDRLFQALPFLKNGRIKKLMFSGGSGSIRYPDHKEGIYIKKYLNSLHIPDSSLIIESESKNTHENAKFSKKMLDSLGFKGSVLLVTSAYHMKRAIKCFRKEGFTDLTPYVTNRISGPRKFEWDHCLIPNPDALFTLNFLIHEWIGSVVYWVKGYI